MLALNGRLLETIDILERRLQHTRDVDLGREAGDDDDEGDEEELFSPLARILYTQMLGDCYCELRSSAYYPAAALSEFEDRAESAYRSAVNLAAGIALAPTDPLRLLSTLSLCKALVQLRGRRRRARHLALRLYTQATLHSHELGSESARLLQALRDDFVPLLTRAEQEAEQARREREDSAYSSDESSLEDGTRAGDDDDSDDEDLFDEDGNRLDPGGEAPEAEEEGEGDNVGGAGPQTEEGDATAAATPASVGEAAVPTPTTTPSSKPRATKPPPSPAVAPRPASSKAPATPTTPARTPSKGRDKDKDKSSKGNPASAARKSTATESRARSPSPSPMKKGSSKSPARGAPGTPSGTPSNSKSKAKAASKASPQHAAGLELNQRPEGLHLLPKRARSAIATVKGLRGLVSLPAPVMLDPAGGVASAAELYRALYRIFSVYVRGAGLPGHAAADYKVTVDGQEVSFSAYLLSGPYMSFRGLCVVLRDFGIAKLPSKKKAPSFPAIHDPPGAVREFKAAGAQAPLSIREAVLLFIEASRSAQPVLTAAAFAPVYAALAAQERASSVSLFKEQVELAFRPDGQATVKTGQSPWDRALAWAAAEEENWEDITCGLNFMQFLDFVGKAALVAYSAPRFEAAFPTPVKKIEHFLSAHLGLMDSRRWLAKVDSRVNALKYTIAGLTTKAIATWEADKK